jgi:hypothetical protein
MAEIYFEGRLLVTAHKVHVVRDYEWVEIVEKAVWWNLSNPRLNIPSGEATNHHQNSRKRTGLVSEVNSIRVGGRYDCVTHRESSQFKVENLCY